MENDSATSTGHVSGKTKRRTLIRVLRVLAAALAVITIAFLIYFPGRQTPMACSLGTGIGAHRLQERVDALEEKAITGQEFTAEDRRFLEDLYTCFAKGGRLTIVLRQSSQLMRHYLSKSGTDLRLAPRIFVATRALDDVAIAQSHLVARKQPEITFGWRFHEVFPFDPKLAREGKLALAPIRLLRVIGRFAFFNPVVRIVIDYELERIEHRDAPRRDLI